MKISILALALLIAVHCAHPEKHAVVEKHSVKKSVTPSKKESAQVHMAAKTTKSLRMLKKKTKREDGDECDSCGDEKKMAGEQKEQAGEIGSLKAEVLTLTTSNTELKTLTTGM